jgi:hypothetical protein
MANWEKKSSYLLREIVKFRTYIDCLQAAQVHKEKIYKEREEDRKWREQMRRGIEAGVGKEVEDDEGDTTITA